jgi:hypothetical protein
MFLITQLEVLLHDETAKRSIRYKGAPLTRETGKAVALGRVVVLT